MNHHDLKIWPEHYRNVKAGTKTFEIRRNDRGYQKGDYVELHYWPQWAADTETLTRFVTDTNPILKFKIGDIYPIDAERVVFSLLPQEPK